MFALISDFIAHDSTFTASSDRFMRPLKLETMLLNYFTHLFEDFSVTLEYAQSSSDILNLIYS